MNVSQALFRFVVRGVVKKDILRSGWPWATSVFPPPPYGNFFVTFFWCVFILVYNSMCSEKDFTQEKVNFHATTGIPNSSSYCCCPPDDHLQEAGPSFWQPRQGHEKLIFETLHNEINVFWVSKNPISIRKKSKFSYLLYGQLDRKISTFFDDSPKIILTVQIEKQRAVSLFVAYYLPHNAETQNSAKNSHKRVTVRDDLKFQVGVVSGQSQLS